MDKIVGYVRNVAVIVIIGKCIINLLPNPKYEAILRITLSMMVMVYIFSCMGLITKDMYFPAKLDNYEKVAIRTPDEAIIRKGVEECVYRDILNREEVFEVNNLAVDIITYEDDRMYGKITSIKAHIKTQNIDDCT